MMFDKRFVYFMWDDELKEKKVFVSNYINSLRSYVERGEEGDLYEVKKSNDSDSPFQTKNELKNNYIFAYYDPNYEAKRAYYKEGKNIQFKDDVSGEWCPAYNPRWDLNIEYRINPEKDKKWIVYLARPKYRDCYLTACAEGVWGAAQKEFDGKTKLFVGTCDEAVKWYESREKFAEVIKAWEDGKELQFRPRDPHLSWQECQNPSWDVELEYRVKPEEKKKEWWEIAQIGQIEYCSKGSKIPEGWYLCDGRELPKEFIGNKAVEELVNTYGLSGSMRLPDMRPANCAIYLGDPTYSSLREDGIDSKACAGCPQDEARKRKRIEERASKFGEVCVRPEYDDEKCKKCNECIEGPDYRPFKDCDELVEFWSLNYQTVMRPANTKPFIWVRLKVDERERLIVAFGTGFVEIGNKAKAVTLQKLFDDYEFLDGSPCGMEMKK